MSENALDLLSVIAQGHARICTAILATFVATFATYIQIKTKIKIEI
jgi:hypothetical protein